MNRRLIASVAALALSIPTTLVTGTAYATPSSGVRSTSVAPVTQLAAPPTIPVENVMAHLNQLQTIANNNGGNRAHGRPGYRASADYVQAQLNSAGFQTTLQPFTYNGATGWNVIAEWPYGDANNVIFAGAHLDGVTSGPGINDNGSGSSAVLEVALAVSRAGLRPEKRLRFGWWGAEELGLIGSNYYTTNLSQTERQKIKTYLNFDMVGAKDITTWGVYSHTASVSSIFKSYFASRNIGTYDVRWDGSSDHSSFTRYGIPVGGIGSDDDPCYHSRCDDINNVGSRVMEVSTNAIAHTVWNLAGTSTPADDFAMTVSPTSGTVEPGGSVTSTVNTATLSGSPQTVNLSASGLPAGATATFAPASVTSGGTSTLTIGTSASTPAGHYQVTIVGTGTAATRTSTYTLTVNGPGGGCPAPGQKLGNPGFETG
ncbi:M28 family peptidase, partial [Micromonospora sonneratiae]